MTQTIVIAEMNNNAVHPSTAELVSAAMTIGGSANPRRAVHGCWPSRWRCRHGCRQHHRRQIRRFAHYDASGLGRSTRRRGPSQGTIITGASPQSKDLAARLAARRNLSVVQDAVQIEGKPNHVPVYSGKAMQTVASERRGCFGPLKRLCTCSPVAPRTCPSLTRTGT